MVPEVRAVQQPALTLFHTPKKILCFLSAACLLLVAPPAAPAPQADVTVDALRVVAATPDFVDLEVSGTQDGSLGLLCMGVIAKSADGAMRSLSYPPAFVPAGTAFRLPARVMRPAGLGREQTDYLMVTVYPCGKDVVLRRKFAWKHVWPETNASGGDAGRSLPSAAHQAYIAFNENLSEEDFAALDLLMTKWNDPRERDDNGQWKLDSFRSVFLRYSTSRRDWKGDLQRLQKWRALNPRSAGAAIAEARYWAAYAWHIRGNEDAVQTDPVALRVFAERMQRAEQVLQDAKAFSADNPLWYEAYLDIAVAMKRDDRFVAALYDEAVRRHPYFHPLYLGMAKHWASSVSGRADWAKADGAIRQAMANTASVDGTGAYAMLYVKLGELQKCECNLFEGSRLSWSTMRDSFEDLVKRYPSDENLNLFAAFACRANDRRAFLKVRPRIVGHILPDLWLGGYSYDLCDHRFMQDA